MSTTSAPPRGVSARKPSAASAERPQGRPLTALKERLEADLRVATKAQDPVRRETIRLSLAAIHYEEVARRGALDEAAVLQVLGRQAKMRRESIDAFTKGNRPELAAKETAELAVLESYLPAQLGEAEIEAAAKRAIAETGASGAGAQGKVMQKVMAELRGKADGKVVAAVVAKLLSGEGGPAK